MAKVATVYPVGAQCTVDRDCKVGQRCVNGQCENVGCFKDKDCLSGRCLNGQCVACASNLDCKVGQQCLNGRCMVAPSSAPSAAKTGPESIVIMASGAAAGYAWIRRRRIS